jgi:pimeloyl-ACP methyl ester carboxylesterase
MAAKTVFPAWPAVVLAGLVAIGPASAQEKKAKLPAPEDVTLKTSDGVTIAATYYASRKDGKDAGKDVAPLILLHAHKGSRGDLDRLALKLRAAGHAVIAPDLRGHGDSTPLAGDVSQADVEAMVRQDLEAVKGFLVEKNNAAELNIERLGVVGLEMGAVVAINWAALDWSWPVLATGKQGQDVKGIVLVSPEWSFKGARINEAAAHPQVRSEVSALIIVGRRSSALLPGARRLHSALARYREAPRTGNANEKQTLWLQTPQTSLQGTALVNEKSLGVDQMILDFAELRLADPPQAWSVRQSPLK